MRAVRGLAGLLLFAASAAASAAEPSGLHAALDRLARDGKFSGAVVVRGRGGILFARGYGMADPFTGRRFTPATPVDSASLAKPVTAAAVLALAGEGRIELDSPVRRYLPEYPHAATTVRHLLAHSAGLRDEAVADITGKTNAELLAEAGTAGPRFAPGTGFTYCNLCYSTLALLIERVTGEHYLGLARSRAALPPSVTLRPARLADWHGRAIGYRRSAGGKPERADSYDNELFYGTANLSISAMQLAAWGARWWDGRLAALRPLATRTATIAGKPSGLSWGNWNCAPGGRRCHYLGHHEGFHHMLYWDSDRRLSVAMVTNNTLAPGLHQRLQRALVAFASGASPAARRELARPLADVAVPVGRFDLGPGEQVAVAPHGKQLAVRRHGIDYPAYQVGAGIRYVPGLDLYLAGVSGGRLHWLTLYEDRLGRPVPEAR